MFGTTPPPHPEPQPARCPLCGNEDAVLYETHFGSQVFRTLVCSCAPADGRRFYEKSSIETSERVQAYLDAVEADSA